MYHNNNFFRFLQNLMKQKMVLFLQKNIFALCIASIVWLTMAVFLPSISWGYLLKDEKRGTHLSIFGLGMVRLNYASVDGNVALFEESEDGFLEEFDTQEILSLTASGTIFHDYALEGEVHYNQDDHPDWNFLAKLSRDESYLIFGDQPNIFLDPYFTRYTEPFRGLTLHLESETFGVTTFGAITRGETEKEEIIPDGTSGPYNFSNIPVVPGSEIVTIEIRNQYDQNEVLEILSQEPNVDYTIDYDLGEITFAQPVDSETFRGELVVIVVIYKGQSDSTSFNTALFGSRATVTPTGWANIGVTYVSEFDRDPSISDGFDARREVYGIDSTLTFGETWKLYTEYALSQRYANATTEGDPQHALRAELDGKIGAQFDLRAQYQRAERDFLTFANPDIETNEQQLDVSGIYAYRSDHSLKVGYGFLQDNLPQDSESATTTTHRPYIEWEAFIREHTELFSKYEFIRITDDQTPAKTDKQTHTFLAGGVQEFLRVLLLKKLTLRGEYQLSDFEDKTDQEADTMTHQVGLRLKSEPAKDIIPYVEQRERWIYDKDLGKNTERQDISEVGLELNRWERFSLQSKYQYRVAHDLLNENRESERHIFTLNSKYQLLSDLTGSAKFELRDETFFVSESNEEESSEDSETQTLNLEGRLRYTPKKDLTFRLRYEYEQTEDKADTTSTTREDETEFRVNYAFDKRKTRLTGVIKLERDLTEAPPTPETETRTITYLASAARQLTEHWDAIAQYKRETGDLSADNVRDDILAEIGYSTERFLKVVAGYQYTDFSDNNDSANDYTANSVYVKIIGKL